MITIFLAQFFGLFLLGAGVSMLVQKDMIRSILNEVYSNRALVYVIGIFEVACGILLVLIHNHWSSILGVSLVTLMSWILLIEGGFYASASKSAVESFRKWIHHENVYIWVSVGYLVLGGYLTFFGFILYF